MLELAAVELAAVRPGQLAAVALAVVLSLPHVAVTVTPEALLVQFRVSRNLLSLTRQRTARYEYDKLFQPNLLTLSSQLAENMCRCMYNSTLP